jgi:purine-binding chemotaxis protein CheW
MPSTGKFKVTGAAAGPEVPTRESQFVCFQLAGDEYGIDVSFVEKIIRPREIHGTAIPSSFVRGTISWDGHEIPLIDMRLRLGYPALEDALEQRIVIVNYGERIMSALIDSVSEVLRIDDGRIKRGPADGKSSAIGQTIEGVFQDEDKLVYILDGVRIFGQMFA